jgi:hypothetical protein
MKKIILAVILLAAAGGGIYYLLKKPQSQLTVNKELITGKWKINSLDLSRTKDSSLALLFVVTDSNLYDYEFDIDTRGLVIQRLNGVVEDTTHYEFTTGNELLLWARADSAKTKWVINKLDSLNMVLRDKDSTVFSFQKVK